VTFRRKTRRLEQMSAVIAADPGVWSRTNERAPEAAAKNKFACRQRVDLPPCNDSVSGGSAGGRRWRTGCGAEGLVRCRYHGFTGMD